MAREINSANVALMIAGLRRLAAQAPPGPWLSHESSGYGNPNVRNESGPIFSTGNAKKRSMREKISAARFVASANPATILELCDVLEQAMEDRQALMNAAFST